MGNRTPAGCFSEHLWSRGTLGSETVLNPEASKLQTLTEPYVYEHVLHVISYHKLLSDQFKCCNTVTFFCSLYHAASDLDVCLCL